MRARVWVLQYGVSLALALGLGALFGHLPLFRHVTVGAANVKAADLAQFLGYGGGLALLWLMARRAARELPEERRRLAPLRHLLSPAAAMLILSVGYKVPLFVFAPFLGKMGRAVYDWLFVAAILGTALWLITMWFRHSAELAGAWGDREQPALHAAGPTALCDVCGSAVDQAARYCAHCGRQQRASDSRPKIA